jgi:hypothetical protein
MVAVVAAGSGQEPRGEKLHFFVFHSDGKIVDCRAPGLLKRARPR